MNLRCPRRSIACALVCWSGRRVTEAVTLLFLIALLSLMRESASAQFLQQGGKLFGTGATGFANQGYSVSFSADSNTAIVGGPSDSNGIGAAWVFTRTGGVWSQQGGKLVGTGGVGNANQGFSVAISADGNTAVVGGNQDSNHTGATWVFIRSGGVWSQQGGKLVGTGAVGSAGQGVSVAISGDGNTAIAGGLNDNSGLGACWVFVRSGSEWAQQGSKLVGTGAAGLVSYQGYSVALAADGNTAIVGGAVDNSNTGAAWVFTRSGSVWTQQGSKLVGTGAVGGADQGTSVSISADGNTAIVGGPVDNSLAGAAWVFIRSLGVWSQQGSKLVGTGAVGAALQGASVSLAADGNTAIVGGSQDSSNAGAAWVYTRSGGVWTQQGSKLVGTGAVGISVYQGYSVSLAADGNTAIVGGRSDRVGIGATWVYTRAGGVWTQQGSKLVGTGAVSITRQGTSVGLSADGNTAVAGATLDSLNIGATWVFTRTSGVWTQQGSKLVGTGPTGGSAQGSSASLSADGNTAIIGGPADSANKGAAWIFTRTGDMWTQQGSKLFGTGSVGSPQQGGSVCLSADGNTAIVGGRTDNVSTGAAWVFTRTGGIWTQQGSKLVDVGASVSSLQGTSVSISGDGNTAIMGGPGNNSGVGAAWIYTRTGGVWTQFGGAHVGTGATGSANQGSSVSISADGNTAIVGGPFDSSHVGAAWVYSRVAGVWSQQGGKLVGTGHVGFSEQGASVSISSDGNTAIVGGYADSSGAGAAWVFTRTGGVWSQYGGKLVGTGAVGASNQAKSSSLSADGHTAIVGGPFDYSSFGAAWVFAKAQTTIEDTLGNGWNMVSVPLTVEDYHKTVCYPTAISNAFAYQGGYLTQPILVNGKGYWLKFDGNQTVPISGYERTLDSIDVASGWNLVGSLSAPVSVSSITSSPGGIVTSPFFGYDGSYQIAATIDPGQGYWVRAYQAGKLYLSTANAAPEAGRIRIVENGATPPPPPDHRVVSVSNAAPREYALEQNYPNPFNPVTIVRYQVPSPAHVVLSVYNLLGQKVETLVNGPQSPGYKSVSWDASGVPSGIYYYRLTAGSFMATRSMMVIK
jgi:limonene-1,2-epoxide hydrolase